MSAKTKNSQGSSSKWDSWNLPLNRTFFIAVAASSILGIGIWIGRAFSNSGISQVQTDLGLILNYIEHQNLKIDSLSNLIPSNEVDPKYLVLDDFNGYIDVTCSLLDSGKVKIAFKTNVFAFIGDGIHEYESLIEKYVDGKYILDFSTGKRFYTQEGDKSWGYVNYTINNVNFYGNEKYRLVLKVGNYKGFHQEFICN